MNIKNDKRIIIENIDDCDNFYLEEYFGGKYGKAIIGGEKVKRLKIEIDTFDIKDAINFLQEYQKK